jgi:hypothetical protein
VPEDVLVDDPPIHGDGQLREKRRHGKETALVAVVRACSSIVVVFPQPIIHSLHVLQEIAVPARDQREAVRVACFEPHPSEHPAREEGSYCSRNGCDHRGHEGEPVK